MKNGQKSIRLNTIQSKLLIWINPNQVFNSSQSESVQAQIDLNRVFNPYQFERIRLIPTSNLFELGIRFTSIWAQIESDWKCGLD